jgi:hypothetical protein
MVTYKCINKGINIYIYILVLIALVLINLTPTSYHLVIFTNQLLLFFQIKNHNQNYKHFIDFILIFKNHEYYYKHFL